MNLAIARLDNLGTRFRMIKCKGLDKGKFGLDAKLLQAEAIFSVDRDQSLHICLQS